jgi:hypothetical protein
MLASFLLAIFLVVLGAGLIVGHVRAWRAALRANLDERELAFSRRQFRRRRQASTLVVFLGLAIAGGELITAPWAGLCYWSAVLVLVLWIVGLAVIDWVASQQHFGLHRAAQDAELALLQRELKQSFGHRHNGLPPADETPSSP